MNPKEKLEALRRLDYLLQHKWTCDFQDRGEECPNNGQPHAGHPYKHARDNQLAPDGEWTNWFLMSGRGFGKTRTGAEYCKKFALDNPESRIAIVTPDFRTGRDVTVEGESGLRGRRDGQGVLPWEYIDKWNRSLLELDLKNGSQFKIFSAEEYSTADKIRGYQCHLAWFDELSSQKAQDHAWSMMEYALRLGDYPRTVITSTPQPTKLIKTIVADPETVVTTGSTYDNADNLPANRLKNLKKYANTRLGQQELFGKLLLEAVGALWTGDQIKRGQMPDDLARVVVAVDPAGSHKAESDETGIVVAGLDFNNLAYVMADLSGRYAPEQWSRVVNEAYDTYNADCVVAEKNYGGELVRSNLRSVNKNLPLRLVHTRIGKKRRAEPVQHLYERNQIFHVGLFEKLEDQMTTWIPPGRFDVDGEPIVASSSSPDRMDAMVYALTELLLRSKKIRGGAHFIDD